MLGMQEGNFISSCNLHENAPPANSLFRSLQPSIRQRDITAVEQSSARNPHNKADRNQHLQTRTVSIAVVGSNGYSFIRQLHTGRCVTEVPE